ncbi:MAG: carboxymuconolactone decarboxylase family protein [Candidatus Puniceispirillum sp.]|nr:carboxymuconolactone decarboxylase family protein [Candidatus Puniceispirillum sp.]MBL6774620.1 carboxymuconolactone decarboxylase family protein [Candidatus Puniceispirillum sp.]
MARLPALDHAQMTAKQKEIYQEIASGPRGNVRGPLAVWLHRPDLADKAQQLGRYCRYDSSLSPRLSELAILTTARIWDAAFEWQAHVPHARAAGVDEEIIDALANDQAPEFAAEDEALVYEFTRELNLARGVSDALYARTIAVLGKDRTVDLVGVLGYYSLISMTIKAFDVDLIGAV